MPFPVFICNYINLASYILMKLVTMLSIIVVVPIVMVVKQKQDYSNWLFEVCSWAVLL